MLPGITEYTRISSSSRVEGLWLDSARTKRATLHQATASFEEMGERTISTQIRVDGSIAPQFNGWELDFRGETFILPTLKPQAAKDNTTMNSLVDLVFTSSPIDDLKRFYFAEMAEIEVGTVIIDKYVASLRLNLTNFVAAFNKVLSYYFPSGKYVMTLASGVDTGEVKDFPIDYMYIWEVLQKIHEIYGVSWRMTTTNGVTTIAVGAQAASIPSTDHVFQYGFDGGLLRFERHVEDTDIYNVLLGRGGEKNIPYRYFKKTDEFNPIWAADPDAIPELRNLYFSRLLDSNFRNYIQGWKTNPNRDTTTWEGIVVESYDSTRGATDWAYAKGHSDTKFDPVEYVKDDDSIALYGIRQGKLDDNEDIFPTIQGVDFPDDNPDIGRVDEVIAVEVTAEDSPEAVYDVKTLLADIYQSAGGGNTMRVTIQSSNTITIPADRVGRIEYAWMEDDTDGGDSPTGKIDTTNSVAYVSDGTHRFGMSYIPPGTYHYCVDIIVDLMSGQSSLVGKYGIWDIMLHCTPTDGLSYRQVFTIWIKNLWQSTQQSGETDVEYAHRIWDPILGDKLGQSAAVCFSDGFMSTSEDYEFLIQKLPEVDRTKSLNGVSSEWKLTLVRSDAEYEATGLYIPNTQTGGLPIAGDHFFFTGIDIPIYYVKWAERKLTQYKQDALDDNAWTNPTWVVSLDKIKASLDGGSAYAGTLAEKLDAGVLVTITDPRFTRSRQGEQQKLTLGIRTLTFTWNEPSDSSPCLVPEIEVVLSDKIEKVDSYQDTKSEVDYISTNYATRSSVKKINRTTILQTEIAIDGNFNYLGPVIGTVEI